MGDQHLRDENQSHGSEILGVLNHVFQLSCLRRGGIAGGWSILCKDFVYSAYKLLFVPVERCVCVCVCVCERERERERRAHACSHIPKGDSRGPPGRNQSHSSSLLKEADPGKGDKDGRVGPDTAGRTLLYFCLLVSFPTFPREGQGAFTVPFLPACSAQTCCT